MTTFAELEARRQAEFQAIAEYDRAKPKYKFSDTDVREADEARIDQFNDQFDAAVRPMIAYRPRSQVEMLQKLGVFFDEMARNKRGASCARLDIIMKLGASCAADVARQQQVEDTAAGDEHLLKLCADFDANGPAMAESDPGSRAERAYVEEHYRLARAIARKTPKTLKGLAEQGRVMAYLVAMECGPNNPKNVPDMARNVYVAVCALSGQPTRSTSEDALDGVAAQSLKAA